MVRNVFDHPVCASKVASQHFVDAQPPLLWRRGMAAVLRFIVWQQLPSAEFLFKRLRPRTYFPASHASATKWSNRTCYALVPFGGAR